MTPDLTAFLNARLDEDEAVAHIALRMQEDGAVIALANSTHGPWRALSEYDPARALREVEAKRSIIKAHNRAEHYCPLPVLPGRHSQLWTPEEGPCWTLRLLAAVYSDHPDYRQEWAS